MADELRKLHNAELYILDEIDRICKKNGIKYFLAFGSMLGAVRHKGFIPWDDDIDIGMYLDDYLKFIEVAPRELKKDFFLDNEDSDSNYALVFSKVRLLGTEFIENKGNINAEHNEIFVDIFPFFNIASDAKERKKNGILLTLCSLILLSKSGYHVWKGEGILKKIKFFPIEILSHLITKKKIRQIINTIFNKYPNKTGFVCPHIGSKNSYLNWIFPTEIIFDYLYVPFENGVFPILKDYNLFLRIVYGDNYMQLPPENKRITHNPIKLTFGRYKEF